jgi:hypothetical protein
MPELLTEVERFRSWAATLPPAERGGEWECDYNNWNALYTAVLTFVDARPLTSWSPEELSAVLYAVARDNEMQHLSHEIRERGDDLLLNLAEASLKVGEADAKWQLATELGNVETDVGRREELLRVLARDQQEYVRRRALQSLAHTRSPKTEQLALEAWSRADESQEWARMMALWALHHIRSPRLETLLEEAERDARPYLSEYAAKIRRGDVEPYG